MTFKHEWETPPKHEPTVGTCVNVMASRLEYEAEYPLCETCRHDEPNNPICDECIAGEDKPSNYEPDFWHSATKDDWLKAHGLK